MDSTMLYQLVLEQLHTGKELLNLLPPLGSLLNPHSAIATSNMNDQQIFSQIHKSVNKALHTHQQDKEQLLAGVPQDEGEISEQISEEENDWGLDEEENEENEEKQQNQDPYGHIEEEENEDDLQEMQGEDEGIYEGEDDVGLYGEEIDEQEMQSYENEGDSEQERQFEEEEKQITSKNKRNTYKQEEEEGEDEGEDIINDQFNHFREVQIQNQAEEPQTTLEKTDLQKQIEKLEDKVINKKDWVLRGEVKGTQRPTNSLLQYDLQFKTGIRLNQDITPQYNSELENMIKQRILDELYDDRVRYQHSHVLREQFSTLKEVSKEKSKLGLGELYEAQFKNFLGLGDNKTDKLKQEILESFKEVNYYLDSLSNCNFTPRPSTGSKNQVVISEEKVPITMWRGSREDLSKNIQKKIVSEKEEDKHGKRLKNKRIARQRNKEQMRKKLNKKIEYGGMTKFQAKAMAQRAKNNLNEDKVKYNKSANFFAEMNKEKKGGKPNPNLSKLKI